MRRFSQQANEKETMEVREMLIGCSRWSRAVKRSSHGFLSSQKSHIVDQPSLTASNGGKVSKGTGKKGMEFEENI